MIAMLAMQMDQPAAAAPACTAATIRADAPAGWSDPVAIRSGATIRPSHAATLDLVVADRAGFAVPSTKPAAMGASVAVVVPRAGRWRVSLDKPAWIDLVGADRRVLTSIGHGHGAACSGVRKSVEFDLPAGRYLVQLSAATALTVRVMVSPVA